MTEPAGPLSELRGVRRTFPKASGGELLVLDGIDLQLASGEIVCLLGRSGSGKSTLLRILAGLLPPTDGEVSFEGKPLLGPAVGISLVFQSFALFPWLTVLGNVELGLEAQGLPSAEIRRRALEAIDLIGLDGFESAYPKELSGGMRQRVGFARALVVHPRLLLMDEAFSALDVLTAENLRADFLALWTQRKLPIDTVLLVTHNIEEAVLMGDRIVLLSTHPGRISDTIEVGRADLPVLGERFYVEGQEFLSLADAARRLGFALLEAGDIQLTAEGMRFAECGLDERKRLFAEQLLRHVPLASHVLTVLEARPGKRAPRTRFQEELEDHLSPEDARTTLNVVTSWGRFAESFAYDDQDEAFSLDDPG